MWHGKILWRNALDGFSARKRVFSPLSLGTKTANLDFYIPLDNERQQCFTEHEKFLLRRIIPHSPATKIEICFESNLKQHFSINKMSFTKWRRVIHREALEAGLDFCIFSASSCSRGDSGSFYHTITKVKWCRKTIQETKVLWLYYFFSWKKNVKSHCLDHYSAIKRTKLLIHKGTWVNLHRITLS